MATFPPRDRERPLGVGPSAGTRVGDYTLLTRIGEGGMGVVHLARAGDGQRVALKMLRPHIVGDDEARQRLAREVGSLSRVRSRWVAEIIDADPWAEIPYVATRYVPGLSLHDHVHAEGPIGGADLLWFAGALAEGVAAVHGVGVLHRDVKPSNVLMEGRTPILIDFGLARVADDPKLTHTGWLLGTPGYLAPEILYGEDATAASDVHSWAATVAFAGCGHAPFGRGPSMAIMDRVRRGQFDLDGLSGPLREVVASALDPDPERRPSLDGILAWLRPQTTQPSLGLAPPPAARRTEVVDHFTLPLSIAASAHDGPRGTRALLDDAATTSLDPTPPSTRREAMPAPPPPRLQPLPPFEEAAERVPPAERLRRLVTGLTAALAAAALLTVAPWVVLAVLALVVWLLRSGSLATEMVGHRRRLRGRKWYDAVLLLLHTPWRIVQAAPGTLALVLWSAGLAAAAALIGYAVSAAQTPVVFLSAVVLVLSLWSGPGGSRVRSPLSRVLRPASRTAGWWMLTVGGLLATALACGLVVQAAGVSWTPADHAPLSSVLH